MSKIVYRLAGISLAAAFACGLAISANAQLAIHKDSDARDRAHHGGNRHPDLQVARLQVSANVVGRNGEILVAMRGDDTGPHTLENSMKKAYTARAQRRPSGEFRQRRQEQPHGAGALRLTNMVPAQGALPIKVGEDTIGAIGVSGAPGGDKDEACAKAGIDKVANELK